jgi:hypothetical protein
MIGGYRPYRPSGAYYGGYPDHQHPEPYHQGNYVPYQQGAGFGGPVAPAPVAPAPVAPAVNPTGGCKKKKNTSYKSNFSIH